MVSCFDIEEKRRPIKQPTNQPTDQPTDDRCIEGDGPSTDGRCASSQLYRCREDGLAGVGRTKTTRRRRRPQLDNSSLASSTHFFLGAFVASKSATQAGGQIRCIRYIQYDTIDFPMNSGSCRTVEVKYCLDEREREPPSPFARREITVSTSCSIERIIAAEEVSFLLSFRSFSDSRLPFVSEVAPTDTTCR